MFPTATSVIYRNEEGEVLGWDSPSDYEPTYLDPYDDAQERWQSADQAMVCSTHHGWAVQVCPDGVPCLDAEHIDALCCGPEGCCTRCCGTEDEYKQGTWHQACDLLTA